MHIDICSQITLKPHENKTEFTAILLWCIKTSVMEFEVDEQDQEMDLSPKQMNNTTRIRQTQPILKSKESFVALK